MGADAIEPRIISETGIAKRVADLIEPLVEDMGYRLVRVRMTGSSGSTLQIMADRPDGTLRVEDCVLISRAVSPVMEVEDPIHGAYELEVSSPGIDRPLVRPSDFERWAGHEAKVEMAEAIEGQRRFRGILEGFEDGEVRLYIDRDEETEPVLIGLAFDRIAQAKLVMTDALIALAKTSDPS